MRSLYVYYKVEPTQAGTLREAVYRWHQALRNDMPGLVAALHQRADTLASDATLTWMETYHFNGHPSAQAWDTFEQLLATQATSLPAGIVGPRHVEKFERLHAARNHD
jgi:hypothetical protein